MSRQAALFVSPLPVAIPAGRCRVYQLFTGDFLTKITSPSVCWVVIAEKIPEIRLARLTPKARPGVRRSQSMISLY